MLHADDPAAERRPKAPPEWALRQRQLVAAMDEASVRFQERYTRPDGSLVWRERWPGMDGSDDGYESFGNWPLYYALGGRADLKERSAYLWEAITRQFTAYGQIHDEFDGYYDWMHHGEGYFSFYCFGLSDPGEPIHCERARRFASLYMKDEGPRSNWDATNRRLRSPLTGSRGPRYETTFEDWSTHRWILSNYPVPFEDLDAPTRQSPFHPEPETRVADWEDDAVFAKILKALNDRQMRADVPLNLAATSLMTHAYLFTGEEAYRGWVLDYLEAWAERIERNGGWCPDNIGQSGEIGETMGGKWWGGYYGWRWPHGANSIIEPLTIAASNALLLTGDYRYLEIPRGQIRRLLELGREEKGRLLVPTRRCDSGWGSYRPLSANWLCYLWYFSQAEEDAALIDRVPQSRTEWLEARPGRGKGDDIHFAPWMAYLRGGNFGYPNEILRVQYEEVARRMEKLRRDDGDPATWDVHHWQQINPVHTEALSQLACGGPQAIYHGGLWHARFRYFDADAGRPGLPPDVAALCESMDATRARMRFVNLNPTRERRLEALAGAYGEHRFVSASALEEEPERLALAGASRLELSLRPGDEVELEVEMERYCRRPSYAV